MASAWHGHIARFEELNAAYFREIEQAIGETKTRIKAGQAFVDEHREMSRATRECVRRTEETLRRSRS